MRFLLLIILLAPQIYADPIYITEPAVNAGPAQEYYTTEPTHVPEAMPVDPAFSAPATDLAECYNRDAACQAAHPGTEGYKLCANYTVQCERQIRGY